MRHSITNRRASRRSRRKLARSCTLVNYDSSLSLPLCLDSFRPPRGCHSTITFDFRERETQVSSQLPASGEKTCIVHQHCHRPSSWFSVLSIYNTSPGDSDVRPVYTAYIDAERADARSVNGDVYRRRQSVPKVASGDPPLMSEPLETRRWLVSKSLHWVQSAVWRRSPMQRFVSTHRLVSSGSPAGWSSRGDTC